MTSFCLRINHGHHRNLILTCCPICYVPDTGICPAHPCPSVLTRHKANYVLYEQEKKNCKVIPQSTCMTHIIWHGKNTVDLRSIRITSQRQDCPVQYTGITHAPRTWKEQQDPRRAYILFLSWTSTSSPMPWPVYWLLGFTKGQDENYWFFKFLGLEPNQQIVDPVTFCTMNWATPQTHTTNLWSSVLVPFLHENSN